MCAPSGRLVAASPTQVDVQLAGRGAVGRAVSGSLVEERCQQSRPLAMPSVAAMSWRQAFVRDLTTAEGAVSGLSRAGGRHPVRQFVHEQCGSFISSRARSWMAGDGRILTQSLSVAGRRAISCEAPIRSSGSRRRSLVASQAPDSPSVDVESKVASSRASGFAAIARIRQESVMVGERIP